MSAQTIYVRVTVGAERRDLALVGDPTDAMTALSIGRAVSAAVLESGTAAIRSTVRTGDTE